MSKYYEHANHFNGLIGRDGSFSIKYSEIIKKSEAQTSMFKS